MKNVILAMGLEPVLVPPIIAFAQTLHEQGYEVRVVYGEVKGIAIDYALPFASSTCVVKKADLTLSNKLKIPTWINEQIAAFTDGNTCAIFSFDPISLQGIHKGLTKKVKVFYWQFELYSKDRTRLASLDYWRLLRMPQWIRKNVYMIIAPSASRLQSICKMFNVPPTIHQSVVYNCRRLEQNLSGGATTPPPSTLIADLKVWAKDFTSIAIYSGNISEVAYLKELMAAYAQLPTCGLIFAGTVAASFHQHFYEHLPLLPNVKFVGSLNLDSLADVQGLCDIGFCFYNSMYGGELADPAPNKIGDYIAGNLWMIASGQDYIQSILHPEKLGVALHDISADSIATAVNDIISRPNFKQPQHIRWYFEQVFNMQVQAKPVLDHLQ